MVGCTGFRIIPGTQEREKKLRHGFRAEIPEESCQDDVPSCTAEEVNE